VKRSLALVLIVLGVLAAAAALLADLLGLGRAGIPALQILAAEVGLVIALAGLWLYIRQRQPQVEGDEVLEGGAPSLELHPLVGWVLLGFLLAWLLCFIRPAVFNPERQFRYFTDYIYPREHIGFDTRLILEHVRVWYTGERTPEYLFPPLTTVLFTPLLLLRYPDNFYVVTILTLLSYIVLALVLPLLIRRGRSILLVLFIFGVSIYSYGLQFELDTGQFYTIAMMLVLLAVYIFHRYPAYRFFAYLLFTIAVQLKVTPAIFVFMFVDDWRDLNAVIKRFTVLGLVNFLLLFLLGLPYFRLFLANTLGSTNTIEVEYNHSIEVYVRNLSAGLYGLPQGAVNVGLLQASLYLYYLACFCIALIVSWRRNVPGIDFSLLMVLLLGALMLPSISHDYNLPMLAAPFALYLSGFRLPKNGLAQGLVFLLITAASFAYFVTLFPGNARPLWLENSFPSLFILLTAVTALLFMAPAPEPQGVIPNGRP
jgi:hypothetical protein